MEDELIDTLDIDLDDWLDQQDYSSSVVEDIAKSTRLGYNKKDDKIDDEIGE